MAFVGSFPCLNTVERDRIFAADGAEGGQQFSVAASPSDFVVGDSFFPLCPTSWYP